MFNIKVIYEYYVSVFVTNTLSLTVSFFKHPITEGEKGKERKAQQTRKQAGVT
jgi:hypothetical protein